MWDGIWHGTGGQVRNIWNVLLTLGVYDTIKKGEELQQTDKKKEQSEVTPIKLFEFFFCWGVGILTGIFILIAIMHEDLCDLMLGLMVLECVITFVVGIILQIIKSL